MKTSTTKFAILHFVKVIFRELIYFIAIYFGYVIFSMLYFGEGNNSFMYSTTNNFIYLGLMVIPPIIFNLYKFFKYKKTKQLAKANHYIVVTGILTILFAVFLVYDLGIAF
jgi:hypothetical protein